MACVSSRCGELVEPCGTELKPEAPGSHDFIYSFGQGSVLIANLGEKSAIIDARDM
jgi:hypothetical protein